MKELRVIQSTLVAPKDLYNSFGKYRYRSAESILEALKPLLAEQNCYLTITDSLENVGNRYYIKATATITNSENESVSVSAYAREEETKKGMDGAQITGSASSYARKYALNGLFCIDDTKDPDSTNDHGKGEKTAPEQPKATPEELTMRQNEAFNKAKKDIANATNPEQLNDIHKNNEFLHTNSEFRSLLNRKFKELSNGK